MNANTFLAVICYMFVVAALLGWLFLEPPFIALHLKMLGLFAAIFAPTVFLIWRTDRNREKRDADKGASHG
ncbi:putative membrane protein [Acidovorax delafieldii]|uniref:Membrane protein n=1 Tax=Acidovorax delafieldii TaxID=47920 RepID=A0AAJ2BW95_ACIDE|nr:hypothetical protein [Acidovorax delafieldii]MDR6768668.1 putative membrane protein [Acidovorax delafieldii]MDR6837384.1 putative membrane protein [Acidovorax delafieldii]MDR7366874.1 putative membrane protein [Acidovorax delafieldii]